MFVCCISSIFSSGTCYIQYANVFSGVEHRKQHLFVIQAFAFLYNYYNLTGGSCEASYNMARYQLTFRKNL